MATPKHLVHLEAASESAHAALDDLDQGPAPADARAVAHAADDLLWSLAAVFNRVAEKVEPELAQVLMQSSTRLNAALEELLDVVGRPGQTLAPPEDWPDE